MMNFITDVAATAAGIYLGIAFWDLTNVAWQKLKAKIQG